ncbi:hypothetical protein QTN23_06955 [Pseudomonas shirazica]|uniref:hypothetical protein n=1 Tax=Pseudomonas shirazica TaxID=1940636 RepID=UPI0025A9B130|nr:hypothetical protein [Pseudomonas shirazica]MDM9599225.1 hypothetical protein [Pseudomonas shirazica]MDO2412653.1 hypothetical protein [Pseudomonas shirazica]
MNTTHESSTAYQSALDRTVPSNWAAQLRRDLDELQRLRAVQPAPAPVVNPDKIAAMKGRAIHAGKTKVDRKRAAVSAVVEDHMPQVMAWTGSDTGRACWLTRQIAAAAGRESVLNKDGRPSGWRSVYEYLKTLSL